MNGLSRCSPARPCAIRIAPALLALAVPLLLGACNGDDEPEQDPATDSVPSIDMSADSVPQPNVIGITLQNDTPAVSIPSVCGRQGARIDWQWSDTTTTIQAWRVLFKEGSPFLQGDTLIESVAGNPDRKNGATIDPKLKLDSVFSYVVQVVKEDGDTVGRDPDIVIKDIKFRSMEMGCQDSPNPY